MSSNSIFIYPLFIFVNSSYFFKIFCVILFLLAKMRDNFDSSAISKHEKSHRARTPGT